MASHLAALPATEIVRAGGEALLVRRLGAGPRLLLVHGGPGLDHHLLVPLALPLSRAHEVWLLDLPGHGSSAGQGVGLRQLQERLGRFAAAVEAPAVAGHSLGAFLLRELIRTRTIAPEAAVWIAPPGPLRGREARSPLRLPAESESARREALAAEVEAGGPVDPLVREAIDATVLLPPERFSRVVAEVLPLLRAAVPPCDPRCPVLVVAGSRDPVAPASAVRLVVEATRGARLLQVEGGHFPWAADPAVLARAIERFLAGRLEELPGAQDRRRVK